MAGEERFEYPSQFDHNHVGVEQMGDQETTDPGSSNELESEEDQEDEVGFI